MKRDRNLLEAVNRFNTAMMAQANLREAFHTILDQEIQSKTSFLQTCDPTNMRGIAEAQDRIRFAKSLKEHENLVKTSREELKRLEGE